LQGNVVLKRIGKGKGRQQLDRGRTEVGRIIYDGAKDVLIALALNDPLGLRSAEEIAIFALGRERSKHPTFRPAASRHGLKPALENARRQPFPTTPFLQPDL
jgi:hypothetical protein